MRHSLLFCILCLSGDQHRMPGMHSWADSTTNFKINLNPHFCHSNHGLPVEIYSCPDQSGCVDCLPDRRTVSGDARQPNSRLAAYWYFRLLPAFFNPVRFLK